MYLGWRKNWMKLVLPTCYRAQKILLALTERFMPSKHVSTIVVYPPPKTSLPLKSLCTDGCAMTDQTEPLFKPFRVRVWGECKQQTVQDYMHAACTSKSVNKNALNHWKIEGLLFCWVGVGVQWGNSFASVLPASNLWLGISMVVRTYVSTLPASQQLPFTDQWSHGASSFQTASFKKGL